MITTSPGTPDMQGQDAGAAAFATLVAWTFGLAPVLLFVLTWTDELSPLQNLARAYGLPVVAAQLAIILVSFKEGLRLGRPQMVPLALLVALGILAWATTVGTTLLLHSLLRTGIWTIQLAFALAIVNLWHHRMLDFEKFRTAILTGFVVVFVLLVAFMATTDRPFWGLVFNLPAFGHARWYGYYAAAAIGLCAPGFLRRDKFSLAVATIAFTMTFWTGTRGALVAAVAGYVVCAILFRDFRAPRAWLLFVLSGLAGLVIAFGLDAVVPFATQGPDSMARYGSTYRVEIWQDTLDAISRRPWLGWGEAQFREIFRGVWPFAQPHNVVLQVLLAWGAVGASLCVGFAVWVAPRFLKARSAEAAPFQCAALVLAAYSMFDGALYYAHSLALFVFCCAAAVAAGLPGESGDERGGSGQ